MKQGILTAAIMTSIGLSNHGAFAQTVPPYLSTGSRTVDTNGATFLVDDSKHPYPPGPGGPSPAPNSPAPTANFQGLTDNNTAYPPDTHGAVGTNLVVTMLNTQVRVLTRSGAVVTTIPLSTFWSSTNIGSFNEVFDPRIIYDSYNDRWIASAAVDPYPYGSTSGLLIGISRTGSPTNTGDAGWNLRRVKADASSTRFADFPMVGFNKNWIVITANMFGNSTVSFDRQNFYVFNKTNLYAGGFTSPTLLSDTNSLQAGSEYPAVTYDNSLSTLYIVQDFNGNFQGNGYIRLLSISGNIGSEKLNNATNNPVFLSINSTWDYSEPNNGADFAPQLGLSTVKVQNNDARMGNVVYRNGYLWFTHTVFLPAGGSPTHSAIQWWQLNPTNELVQFGRIEDTTGTNYYAFPSIAVNRFNDVLIGFSRYSSNQYVSANYAFRNFNDQLNTMQVDRAFKSGEDSYWKQQLGTPNQNRWGDYSAACVDPVNDSDLWTVQEYSTPHVGAVTNLSGRWAVWWANVTVARPGNDNFASAYAITGAQGTTNGTNVRATKEVGEPNHAGNAGGASVWYNWTAPSSGSVTLDTIGSGFSTLLAVYTGASVSGLTSVGSDNGSAGNGASRVTFTASSGTTYRIAIDGVSGATGNAELNWLQPTLPDFLVQPVSQSVYQGNNVTFTASAIGTPNPTYQWHFNGGNISGATSTSYTINNVQTTATGNYTLVANNTAGSVTSVVATLTVLVSQATLGSSTVTNNTFKFTISQVSGLNYIVQSNTNLATTNWISIATNTAPFTITDTAFTNSPQRFYRAKYKP
jgi:hypothetical protein